MGKRHRSRSQESNRTSKSQKKLEDEMKILRKKLADAKQEILLHARHLPRSPSHTSGTKYPRSSKVSRSSNKDPVASTSYVRSRSRSPRSPRFDSARSLTQNQSPLSKNYARQRSSRSPSSDSDRSLTQNQPLSLEPEGEFIDSLETGCQGTSNNVTDDIIDEETLQSLGEKLDSSTSYCLHTVLAKRWASILANGLEDDQRTDLLFRHVIPDNLPGLGSPKLNIELAATTTQTDKYHINRQVQLGKGISALGMAINILLKHKEFNDSNVRTEILTSLSEAAKILCDLHYKISLTRRAMLLVSFPKTLKDIVKEIPISETLFGPNLGEHIKTAKAAENANFKPKTYNFKPSLNYRGQSRQQRGSRQDRRRPLTFRKSQSARNQRY